VSWEDYTTKTINFPDEFFLNLIKSNNTIVYFFYTYLKNNDDIVAEFLWIPLNYFLCRYPIFRSLLVWNSRWELLFKIHSCAYQWFGYTTVYFSHLYQFIGICKRNFTKQNSNELQRKKRKRNLYSYVHSVTPYGMSSFIIIHSNDLSSYIIYRFVTVSYTQQKLT
jgi:hypothetical protein